MRQILGWTRYTVFVPALASIVGALLLMAQGSIEMIRVVIDAIASQTALKDTIVEVLTAVDAILLGTVLLVIGIGVVVAIIAVVFVGVFVDSNRASDVVSYGLGAGALVAGLAVFAFATKKDPSVKKPSSDAGKS